MRGHWFWDFAFLNSNYHLEHHYFAGVPFYRLPALQRALLPFYARHQMRWQNYSGLIYGWLVENRAPHTNWCGATRERGARCCGCWRVMSALSISLLQTFHARNAR